jgi:hypothetical protein
MVGLVEEIQADALDARIPVSTLLRKVKVAAVKLKLAAVENWVNMELNGYSGNLPEYRELKGRPKAYNPIRGQWIPIIDPNPEVQAVLSQASTGQSIAEIEDLLKQDSKGTLQKPLPTEIISAINQSNRFPLGEMSVHISRSDIAGILDRVRTMILDWALELEKHGVMGEGLSFTKEEKERAVTNYNIQNFNGVIGNNNQVRDIIGGDINLTDVRRLTEQLRSRLGDLAEEGADADAVDKATSAILQQLEASKPDHGVIRGLLQDCRNAISNAAGGMISSGALALIAPYLAAIGH